MAVSLYKVDTHRTPDTLSINTLATMGTGTKGSLLVDNGTDVIQQAVGTDAYIVTLDSGAPTGVSYQPYQIITNDIYIPLVGGITSAGVVGGSSTAYSEFNVRTAMNSRTSIDYYSVPYTCTIHAIELIILPNAGNFAWPSLTTTRYYECSMGYENAGVFTLFPSTTNPHFTIGPASPPIVGVTNFNRSGLFSVVRFVPANNGWTWNVTPGMHITLRCVNIANTSTIYITPTIYVKGSF